MSLPYVLHGVDAHSDFPPPSTGTDSFWFGPIFGIGSSTRTRLNVSLREGSLSAFGYVLHLEFPEPGMYSFERLLNGPMHRWLLWDQHWMTRQLYVLREAGLLSKVSEID